MGRGELGCSDLPDWSDGDQNSISGSKLGLDSPRKSMGKSASTGDASSARGASRAKRRQDSTTDSAGGSEEDDGTDDYLHHPLPASEMPKPHGVKSSEHADIQSLQEGAEIAGKVVLLKRGGCGFLEKVKWAQRRGGVALIVGDDVRGGALVRMYAHGDTSNITIPAIFTSYTTAQLLSSLLPTGGILQDLSPEDAAKFGISKSKSSKGGKNKDDSSKKQEANRPTSKPATSDSTRKLNAGKEVTEDVESAKTSDVADDSSWLRSFLYAFGFGNPGRTSSKEDSRRPPSSGNIDWVLVEDWDDEPPNQNPMKTKPAHKQTNTHKPTPTKAPDDFVIGEQDWRDPDLLPQQTSTTLKATENDKTKQDTETQPLKGGSTLPGSGEYTKDGHLKSEVKPTDEEAQGDHKGWFRSLVGDGDNVEDSKSAARRNTNDAPTRKTSFESRTKDEEHAPKDPNHHEGLWVTLTPTNMSASPFFDTLLVLVVSPLVTLTVVYALLLLRSRIRRRRWRAPKSVVDRLPVRTYHTISDSSPAATPVSSSPTTPLLQHPQSQARPTPSISRPRSRTTSEVPATSSSFQGGGRSPEEEKREAGLAEWRRRYGGRQKECVVCLEEYVDGVSRVMSLPCGHEFHADCITPWLVTRRRTCPICKGDVVRSLSQAHSDRNIRSSSPSRSSNRSFHGDPDFLQVQAAETRNDSPSAARPIDDDFDADVEANWLGDEGNEGRRDEESRGDGRGFADVPTSLSELYASVQRGVHALRGMVGFQQRRGGGDEDVDRDR